MLLSSTQDAIIYISVETEAVKNLPSIHFSGVPLTNNSVFICRVRIHAPHCTTHGRPHCPARFRSRRKPRWLRPFILVRARPPKSRREPAADGSWAVVRAGSDPFLAASC